MLSALPSYIMQTNLIPRRVCDDLDKLNRSFLWGHSDGSRRIHLVNWNDVCRPKLHGGLGLRHSRNTNTTYMMKLGWGLIVDKDSLWAQVVRNKYKCGNDLLPIVKRRHSESNVWKGIRKGWDSLHNNIIWRPGNGKTINIWHDNWLPGLGVLKDVTSIPLNGVDTSLSLEYLVDNNGIGIKTSWISTFLQTLRIGF
ncbi:hypothetical protein RIF29_25765 [Crotalaria pallida]|uniref:Uncharacterized protein n=1 Tax=Crotalaria pallida TaxID=3830 RepID=A0AAN9EU93_CROPI